MQEPEYTYPVLNTEELKFAEILIEKLKAHISQTDLKHFTYEKMCAENSRILGYPIFAFLERFRPAIKIMGINPNNVIPGSLYICDGDTKNAKKIIELLEQTVEHTKHRYDLTTTIQKLEEKGHTETASVFRKVLVADALVSQGADYYEEIAALWPTLTPLEQETIEEVMVNQLEEIDLWEGFIDFMKPRLVPEVAPFEPIAEGEVVRLPSHERHFTWSLADGIPIICRFHNDTLEKILPLSDHAAKAILGGMIAHFQQHD